MIRLIMLLTLSGCATTQVCLPQRIYTQEEMTRLAAALSPLPEDSAIVGFINDYRVMREANRVCRGK